MQRENFLVTFKNGVQCIIKAFTENDARHTAVKHTSVEVVNVVKASRSQVNKHKLIKNIQL